jgi:hypothetical protein
MTPHPLDPLSAGEIRAAGEPIAREAVVICWNRDDGALCGLAGAIP